MKKILLILNMIISFSSFAYINLYPTKFEKNITNGAYEEFVLYNRTTQPKKYRLFIEDIGDKKDMSKWIQLYPKSILLKPLEEKSVKLYVKAPKNTTKGVYSSNLVIKEIAIPNLNNKKNKTNVLTMVKLKLKGIVNHE